MYLVFDIGGTNMRIAVSHDGKELGASKTMPTPKDFTEGMQVFRQVAEELTGGEKIEAVAGGIAGPLDKEHTMITTAPNILDWNNKPLKKELEQMFLAPVYLENDAALAGLGEAVSGAGRGHGVVAYVTVSTGIGGVRVVDGAIDRNAGGFEPGHQIVNFDGDIRTLEEYVSGSGLLRRFRKLPKEVTDPALWEETARLLAIGLRNTILHWSPEILVLGGSIILQSPLPFERLRTHIQQSVQEVFPTIPEIKKAELGDRSGLCGALTFLRIKLS